MVSSVPGSDVLSICMVNSLWYRIGHKKQENRVESLFLMHFQGPKIKTLLEWGCMMHLSIVSVSIVVGLSLKKQTGTQKLSNSLLWTGLQQKCGLAIIK